MGLKTHAESRRWLVDVILNCWVFVRAFSNSGAYNFNLTQHSQIIWNFDQSIAVPTNMLNRFQSSCDRQHRQQPLLHNNKWLFSRHQCVLSSAGGKWGWNVDAVRICRYEHKDREKGGLQEYNYTLCWKLNPSQVESISHGQSKSPVLVWCHSCLKIPTQLPYSTASWIWSRKPWNIWIQIILLCWRWTSRSPQ